MSTMALREILAEIENKTFDAKEIRKAVVDRQAQALIILKQDLKEQFRINLKRSYKLEEDQLSEIDRIIDQRWIMANINLRNVAKLGSKTREVITKPGEIIIMDYGPKSNYNAIYDWLMRSGKPAYEAFWTPFLRPIRKYIMDEGRHIRKQTIAKGSQKGEQREAFQAADLFNLGHYQGASIHYALFSKFMGGMNETTEADILNVLKTAPVGLSPFSDEENIFMNISSKFSINRPADGDYKKTITLKIEDSVENQERGRNEEKTIRPLVIDHVKKVLAGFRTIDWVNQEASDSVMEVITKELINTAVKGGAKGLRTPIDITPASAKTKKTIKYKNSRAKVKVSAGRTPKGPPAAQQSYLTLMNLINKRLPPKVRENMGSPRLNNRTGRLSESARVTNIVTTAAGFPSIEYTYQRNPYDVFDKTLGKQPWNSPERDPSTLIGLSVRQLATEMGMRRFYTRRAQ